MAEDRPEHRTWYQGAVTGYLTRAEYDEALALCEKSGERVLVLRCGDREAEAG